MDLNGLSHSADGAGRFQAELGAISRAAAAACGAEAGFLVVFRAGRMMLAAAPDDAPGWLAAVGPELAQCAFDPAGAIRPSAGLAGRGFASCAVHGPDGAHLGALCLGGMAGRADAPAGLSAFAAAAGAVLSAADQLNSGDRSRAHSQQILDSAIDYAIISFDLHGRIASWNEGAQRVLGWTADEMLGQPADRIFTPEDVAAGRPATEMGCALREGRGNDERWHMRRDNSRFWAAGEMMPLRDDDGTVSGFIKVLRDRTEHRHMVRSLQDSRERVEVALDTGLIGFFEWDVAAGVIRGDAQLAQITGLEAASLTDGLPVEAVLDAIPAEDAERVRAQLLGCAAQPGDCMVEFRIRPAGCPVHHVLVHGRCTERKEQTALRYTGVAIDVTAVRAAEETGRAAAEFSRRVLASSGDCIKVLDLDGRLLTMTAAGMALMEVGDFEDIRGCPWPDLWQGEARALAVQAMAEARRGGLGRFTAWGNTMRGTPRLWDVQVTPILDASGQPERLLSVSRDVTDRHRAEKRLEELNASLERLVEERTGERDRIWTVSRDLLAVVSADGVFQIGNPAWGRVLGWTEAELAGSTTEWIQHPEDRAAARAEMERLRAGDPVAGYEHRLRTRQGDYRTINWNAVLHEGRIYASGRDVTEERAQDRALRDSMDFARLALGAVGGVGVWTYDIPQDRFVADEAVAALYALDRAQAREGLSAAAFLAHVDPEDLAHVRGVMGRALEREGDVEAEYRIRHPDGTVRWVLSRAFTHFGEDGRPVRRVGVGIETTSRRQLEEQLRQSQKMEAVGQLTGGIAHDFNNMLTAVAGSLELLGRRVQQGRLTDLDRYAASALAACRRAAGLSHRLLAFSRQKPVDQSVTDVNRLIGDMMDMVRRAVGPQIAVETRTDPSLWPALVDAGQLENALLNLCLNARDAMMDGGAISIGTANRVLDEGEAARIGVDAGCYLVVCVTDTGTGMTADVKARAFDPFFTTKPVGRGTGLGLSMIYSFAQQSGGMAAIDSAPGRGTTISLYLPRHEGGAAAEPDARTPAGVPRALQGATALIVDDEAGVRSVIAEALKDLDYRVVEAGDAADSLRILRSDARVDLLITDVGLPGGMDGVQLVEQVRRFRPSLCVLLITGYGDSAGWRTAPPDGVAVLQKPFELDALARKAGELLGTA